MKKYKKKEKKGKAKTKLLQIRLPEKEHKEIVEFIGKFGVTQREWVLTVLNELRDTEVIRESHFWHSDQEYAYATRDKYDKSLSKDSKCELCGTERTHIQSIVRHHHYGYTGENAHKVQIVCNTCHGRLKSKLWKDKDWQYVKDNWVKS